jgi:DnaJ-class molecular chaperone
MPSSSSLGKPFFLSLIVALFLLGCLSTFAEASRDFYGILGISRTASEGEIKKAYRDLTKKWHPDINKSPEAHDKYTEINSAYEVLSDPDKRRKYDQYGEDGLKDNYLEQGGGGFDDFFG